MTSPRGRSAAGATVARTGWGACLRAPAAWAWTTFSVLAAAELAVPAWAGCRASPTVRHPGHIAAHYRLFTIVVRREVILGSLGAVRSAVADRGPSAPVLLTAVGGLLLVLAPWWIYSPEAARG